MSASRICLLASLAALGLPRVALTATVQTAATLGTSVSAFDTHENPFGKTVDFGPKSPVGEFNTVEVVNDGSDSAEKGESIGTLSGRARAGIGDLGVGFTGSAIATDHGRASGGGSARVFWTDELRARTVTLPINAPVTAYFNIFIEGDLAGKVSGDGRLVVQFKLVDINSSTSLPPAPLPNNVYGELIETPTQHVLEEIPGGFRLAKTVLNAATFTLGYEMVLECSFTKMSRL